MSQSERIFAFRKELGKTQKDFALLIGVSQGAVSSWEKGEYSPELSVCRKMAKLKGAEQTYFFPDDPGEIEKTFSKDLRASSSEARKQTAAILRKPCHIPIYNPLIIGYLSFWRGEK